MRVSALAALLLCVAPRPALAQDATAPAADAPAPPAPPSAAEITTAREAFRQGVAAARRSDWDTAYDAFTRSYGIYPRPRTLMNLAGAETNTGRLVEAAESYRRYLQEAGEAGEGAARVRAAERQLAELEQRIPRAQINVTGLLEGDALHLDATALSPAIVGTTLPVDPGPHRLAALRESEEVAAIDFTAIEGLRVMVSLEVPPPPEPEPEPVVEPVVEPVPEPSIPPGALLATGPAPEPIEASSDSPLSQWWFWTIAGAVLISAIVTVGVVIATDDVQPWRGNVPPAVVTLQ